MSSAAQLQLFPGARQSSPAEQGKSSGAPATTFKFLLGTHHPSWLANANVPLFISQRRLRTRRQLPRAAAPWALDSGGFTELSLHGAYAFSAREYFSLVRRLHDETGNLRWAATMDWMCEPEMLKRTGLDVAVHQRRTIAS